MQASPEFFYSGFVSPQSHSHSQTACTILHSNHIDPDNIILAQTRLNQPKSHKIITVISTTRDKATVPHLQLHESCYFVSDCPSTLAERLRARPPVTCHLPTLRDLQ